MLKKFDFRYLKKEDRYDVTGKYFEFTIENEESYFGKEAKLEVHYTNFYNHRMKAVSPNFYFTEKYYDKLDDSILDIINEKF
ncbi:hypothetical protein CHH55_23320 [Niallia circulans]|uniref:hypothetical protein n=1 Tax=Niallia circulans TaxID=1397 RepID=UPI000BA5BF91|nr:hypothetical protein [Niallia circulans]PAD85464.1 hypothetical protein CHH55_23320 [Niallia circulans]